MQIIKNSPWGEVQEQSELAPGIVSVYTAEHGGIFVGPEHLHRIPKAERELAKHWSGSPSWYEEDCCALSVLHHISETRNPEHTAEQITQWHKDRVLNQLTKRK